MHLALIILATVSSFLSLSLAAETQIEALIQTAEQGDAEAQFQLGICFDYGCDGQQDLVAAATWYKRAAEQGHANAQNSLGSLLLAGEGVTQNYAEALDWFQAAADDGLPQGIHNLAYMYDLGLGVPEDNVKAVQLHPEAAEAGHVEARYNIGLMHVFGTGVKKDYETAYMWLDLARFYTQHSENMQLKWQARGYLDELEKQMTASQIKAAKSRSKAWYAIHRQ